MREYGKSDRKRIRDLELRVRRNVTGVTFGSGGGTDTDAFHDGGDSFGAAATIGTNDAFDLNIERGGTTVADLSASRLHLATDYKLQLGPTAAPLGDGTEIVAITTGVNAGLRMVMENTNTSTAAHCTLGAISNENNDCVVGILNSGFTTTGVHVAGDGFLVLSHGAGTSTNTARHLVIANRLASGSLKFGAGDVIHAALLNTGLMGFNTLTARRRVDILDASNPQLRLTHTDNTDYAEFQVDTDGILTLTSSGLYTQIHKSGGGTVGGLTEGQLHFKTVTASADLTNAITFGAHSETSAANHNRAQAGIYFQSSNSAVELSFGVTNNFTNGAVKRVAIQTQGNFVTTPAATGHAVFNEDGVDADLRVEGDTNTSLLHVDASADTVQVNSATTADSAKFYVDGKISTSGEMEINGALNHDGTTVGLFGVTPTTQPTTIADADGTLADITTKFNSLLAKLEAVGVIAS